MIGGLLALLAAASFAYNSATARRAVLTGSVIQGLAITVPLGVPIFFLAALLFGQLGALNTMPVQSMVWLALAGIAHFVWGRYFFYRAQEMLGANLAGSVQQFDLLLSLGLAIAFLGEVLTPMRVLGILLVLIGPALAFGSQRPKEGEDKIGEAGVKRAFTPQYASGYIYIGLAAIGYGISPTLTRLALRDLGPQSSLVGGLIACTAATAATAFLVVVTGRVAHVAAINRETLKWFGVASVSVTFSQMLRFAALSLAPVMVVQPIQRLSKLFLFFFSWWMNREHELFDSRLIIATIVSIIGAAILSVPTEVFVAMADWPPWVVEFLRWQWP